MSHGLRISAQEGFRYEGDDPFPLAIPSNLLFYLKGFDVLIPVLTHEVWQLCTYDLCKHLSCEDCNITNCP